jgi:hypothetical protein
MTIGFCVLVGAANVCAQVPTFTITPSRITNDYVGPITLSIGGIANGQKVIIEKWLDLNGDGLIDPALEMRFMRFAVTDGQQPNISGVRYGSVPGDEDGTANGQIQVVLNYPDYNRVLDHITGQYIFRLIDSLGVFAPVTANFTLVAKSYPQSVSGTVWDASSGLPLTNAVIVLTMPQGNGGGGTVADTNGNFALPFTPGNYAVIATKNGWVGNQNTMVNLASNSNVSVTLSNPPASTFLAGTVTDQSNGKPIAGLFIQASTSSNLIALAFTDTNGNYALPVTADQWKVKISGDAGLATYGYVRLNASVNTSTLGGSQSNLNFQFPKASALIYGQVLDNHSNAVANVNIYASDSSNTEDSHYATTASGNYWLGVASGTWYVQPDSSDLAALNLIGQSIAPTLVTTQALQTNLSLLRITAHLRGRAMDTLGNPIGNISLAVNYITNGNNLPISINQQTASDGTFDLGLFGGQWNLGLECESAAQRHLVTTNASVTLTDGIDQNGFNVLAKPVTATITVTATDTQGNPVNVSTWASAWPNGYFNACGNQNSNTYVLDVYGGDWVVGIQGDLTSLGYDNPPTQTITVTGTNVNVSFTLYPVGQTPARFTNAGLAGNSFNFTMIGSPNKSYRIEASTNPATGWFPLATNTAAGGLIYYSDPIAPTYRARFYRALRLLP